MPGGLSGKGLIEMSIFVLFFCVSARFVGQLTRRSRWESRADGTFGNLNITDISKYENNTSLN